jgi:hypothetical protein
VKRALSDAALADATRTPERPTGRATEQTARARSREEKDTARETRGSSIIKFVV